MYTVGIDFGTLSARAVLLDLETGEVRATATYEYPHGVIDAVLSGELTGARGGAAKAGQAPDAAKAGAAKAGAAKAGPDIPLPAGYALQYPGDYIDALRNVVREVLEKGQAGAEKVEALGFDFTASTVMCVDRELTPLCMKPEFAGDPHAYVKLWKHHGAQEEADGLTAIAKKHGASWLWQYGGKVSSEWYFPKVCETLRRSPETYRAAYRFLEAADWLAWLLTGKETHAPSFAGFKASWTRQNGYPDKALLEELEPGLGEIPGNKLGGTVSEACGSAGTLNRTGAELTGLLPGTKLAVPVIDAHAAFPALGLTEAGDAMLILGTSGCLLMDSDRAVTVPGTCGYMEDGVIPGLSTFEAGQCAVGDIFDWFVRSLAPDPAGRGPTHAALTEKAMRLSPGSSGLVALDWLGGNRSVLADSSLKGLMWGLTLSTRPEEQYRAWIESTAFGFRKILERYSEFGVNVENLVVSGGIALKNPLLMQIYADVTGKTLKVSAASQAGAVGSAVFAASVTGRFGSIRQAAHKLALPVAKTYWPIPENAGKYEELYGKYCALHRLFGEEKAVC